MSNTIGYDLEGFANSTVTTTVTTSVSSDIALYLPFDSDLNDDSTNSHTVTNSGSVAVSTSVKKYGAGSADIPAAADYLEISGGQFDFGSNDFTIEGWFYDDGSGGSRNVALDYRASGGGAAGAGDETFGWFFYLDEGGNGKFFIGLEDESGNSATDLGLWPMLSSSSLAISTNTWTHYAITREGSTFRAFKDGSLIATQTGVSAPNASSSGSAILRIGSGHDSSGSVGMAGYIDDLRIINGAALYTAAFTPPTSAVGLTGDVTNTIVENKFLSSVWNPDDVSEKMADGTWIRNDVTSGANPAGVVVQGAGLEVSGHRWYIAPPIISGVEILAVGAGGDGGNPATPPTVQHTSGGNTVFTDTGTSTYILAHGGGGASLGGGGVGRAGGGAGGFVTASNLQLTRDVGYTVVIGSPGDTLASPTPIYDNHGQPGGSGGGGTYISGGVGAGPGSGLQPSIAQPFISGIPGASGFQNLGTYGQTHGPGDDNPGTAGSARGGGAGGHPLVLGVSSSITGTSVTYAGGGYSGNRSSPHPNLINPGPGGDGSYNGTGGAGVRGGGGGGGNGFGQGGAGGPGMLIIAYPDSEPDLTITGSLSYTQPTRSGYKVYEFTSGSGTISIDT